MEPEPFERQTNKPLYLQIASHLLKRIQNSEWELHADLPEAAEMGPFYGVQSKVMTRALEKLRSEGWVRWNARSEAWTLTEPRQVTGVVLGWDPAERVLEGRETLEVRVLSKAVTTLSRDLLQVFEVHGRDGNRAHRISKLYLEADQPLALETILSPIGCLPGLLMKDHRHENLFRMIENHYGLGLSRVVQKTHVRSLSREEAALLGSAEEFPALCVDQTLYSDDGTVALSLWVLPGGRCGFLQEGFRLP